MVFTTECHALKVLFLKSTSTIRCCIDAAMPDWLFFAAKLLIVNSDELPIALPSASKNASVPLFVDVEPL